MSQITKEELLEKLFHDDYQHLKGKRLRLTRVRVPGKEVCLAHVINPSEACIYENLGLHIGVHEGEDHKRGSCRIYSFHSVGGCGGSSGCSHQGGSCRNRFYGSVLRNFDPYRETERSTDGCRGSCAVFRSGFGFQNLRCS